MGLKSMVIKEKPQTPIIIVPGLFGSIGDDIVPGTGKWHFGAAGYVYNPFIEILERFGYRLNKTLFVSFYDWRKNCTFSAKKYLLETINYVKRKTKKNKVDLICHSMGGLVARAYIQGDFYNYDIEKMIVFGTPNSGSAKAYYFWAGGEVPNDESIEDNIIELIVEGYLWIFGKLLNKEEMEVIHNQFKGIKDLLPSKQHGDYLFYKQRDGSMIFEPYSEMKWKNEFLDKLNDNKEIIGHRGIEVTLIAGVGEETVKYLEIEPSILGELWLDGKVTGEKKSTDGDGTVMRKSVFSIAGDKYIIHDSHTKILSRSEYILREKLLDNYNLTRDNLAKNDGYLRDTISLMVDGMGKILLKEDLKAEWMEIRKETDLKLCKTHYESFSQKLKWLIIKGNNLKNIKIKYISKGKEAVKIKINSNNSIRKTIDVFLKESTEIELI